MSFWEKMIRLFQTQGAEPTLYGWFHLLCLGLMVFVTVLLCLCRHRDSKKTVINSVMITGVAVLLLEIYKQITFGFNADTMEFQFAWYALPWQFCSMPMYVGILAGIIRKGKVHDSLCAFLCTYAVFAGVAVMAYPGNVFMDEIGINIQTMICHGSMIPVAGYLLATGHVKLEHKTILKALPVFLVAIVIAIGINEAAYFAGLLENHEINMFYISRHCRPWLPVYSWVQQVVPYPWSLLIYIGGFTLAGYLMLLMAMGIRKIYRKMAGGFKKAEDPAAYRL